MLFISMGRGADGVYIHSLCDALCVRFIAPSLDIATKCTV